MESVSQKLKKLRELAQPRMSVRALADALGMPHSTYATYENPAKFKKPILPLPLAKRIADVLAPRGVDKNMVLELAGVSAELGSYLPTVPETYSEHEWLTVSGAVVAGIWKEQTEWSLSEQYDVRFGPSAYTKDQRFAVLMTGQSMNRTIPAGSDLECLKVEFSPVPPAPGDLVIVERRNHDLVELSCRRLSFVDGNYRLSFESFEAEFQGSIAVDLRDLQNERNGSAKIIGIVLSAKLDLAPKGLSGRRYKE